MTESTARATTVHFSQSRYTGKERDSESGNDYFGARYYASSMGRWMSPDWSGVGDPVPYASLENPQSLNLYAYLQNNPLSGTDPFGHSGDPCKGLSNCTSVTDKPSDGPGVIALGLAWGHHFVDRAVVAEQGAQNSLAGKFFNLWRSGGPLKSPGVHTGFPKAAQLSQQQVRSIIQKVIDTSGKSMSEWGEGEINEAVKEVQQAGGDTGAFLKSIAAENPTVRTVGQDTSDIMAAAKSAWEATTNAASQVGAVVEEGVETIEEECGGGGCIPPP